MHSVVNHPFSGCKPLLDHQKRVFVVGVGQPRDSTYAISARRSHNLILEEGRSACFKPEERHHRRGNFPAVNVGITYGKGTKSPVNLRHDRHSEMLKRLCSNSDIKRLATFASGRLFPALYLPTLLISKKRHLPPGLPASMTTTKNTWTNFGTTSPTSAETFQKVYSLALHSTLGQKRARISTGMCSTAPLDFARSKP